MSDSHALRPGGFLGVLGHPAVAGLARLAIAAPFLISGVAKLVDFTGTIAEVRALTGTGQAGLVAALVVAAQLVGSILVILGGRYAWIGGGLLAGFTTAATLVAHAFWLKPEAERALHANIFFEHVSIVGGLLLVAVLSARVAGNGPATSV